MLTMGPRQLSELIGPHRFVVVRSERDTGVVSDQHHEPFFAFSPMMYAAGCLAQSQSWEEDGEVGCLSAQSKMLGFAWLCGNLARPLH